MAAVAGMVAAGTAVAVGTAEDGAAVVGAGDRPLLVLDLVSAWRERLLMAPMAMAIPIMDIPVVTTVIPMLPTPTTAAAA